ncbi:MAG TPA: class I SAM-dependent methyltransferase [bacterium]|nr:class I SAM-dependent methyltransferase [bacterium]
MNTGRAQKLKELVKTNYQTIADSFASTRQQPFWPELRKLLKDVPLSGDLLDIGCGNGRLLDELKNRQLASYTGSDLSDNLLTIARQNHQSNDFNFPVTWLSGDLLSKPQRQYQVVCCIAALHHIPSQKLRKQAAKNLADSLANDGYLVISVWDIWQQTKYWPELLLSFILQIFGWLDRGDILFHWKNNKSVGSLRYYHAFTKKELLSLFPDLKLIDFRHDRLNYYFVLQKSKN